MWARALCINNDLHVGSMVPYIKNCIARGLNKGKKEDGEEREEGKVPGLGGA